MIIENKLIINIIICFSYFIANKVYSMDWFVNDVLFLIKARLV